MVVQQQKKHENKTMFVKKYVDSTGLKTFATVFFFWVRCGAFFLLVSTEEKEKSHKMELLPFSSLKEEEEKE